MSSLDMVWELRGHTTTASYIIIDNIKIAEYTEAADFEAGVTFEELGHEDSFVSSGDAPATIERVAYADMSIGTPSNGGEYALKLSHASAVNPTFRIDFGKTLKAGSIVTFDAYASTDGSAISLMYSYNSEWKQVRYLGANGWADDATWELTLPADMSSLDMVWELRGHTTTSSYIIIDNIQIVEPVVTEDADFEAGVTFEKPGHEASFDGIGASQDATITRVSYTGLSITAPTNGGTYALMLSHTSHYYPTFEMNFGKTLPAGTVITFDVYGSFDGWVSGNDMNIELTGDSGGGQIAYMVPEAWFTGTVTLTSDCDHLQFFWNIERNNGISGDVPSFILIDNIVADVPEMAFIDGVTFEEESHASFFTGVGGSNEWRDATFEVVSFDGDNALKLTCASSQWPTFRINFGRTLAAGTVLYFDAYTNDTSGIRTTVSIFEVIANCTETAQYYHGSWNSLSTTLTTDCDHIDLMCNMDRWNGEIGSANIEVYLDNFYAVEPIGTSISFEHGAHAGYFSGIGNAQDATIERVAYADLGVGSPSNGGEYAIKLSRSNDTGAYFRINFGKTLPAGTTVKFDAYSMAAGGQFVLYYVSPWTQARWMASNTWYEDFVWEATLQNDCSYIDMWWETRTDAADSYIIIDNLQFVTP